MLTDGIGWNFTWNAENRLIETYNDTVGKKLEFKYDYMGRRVEKKVYSGSTGNWILDKRLKFVYDGYEQIEELDGANSDAILKKRIWGLNKLICDIHNSTAYYATADVNKNITEYLDSSGTIQAHYEYSPFGKTTSKTGTMQDDFDFRFSSEVFDSETELVYYNYRYYSPYLGRWLSRDLIEEEGGYNIYGFINNNGINLWDELGLEIYFPPGFSDAATRAMGGSYSNDGSGSNSNGSSSSGSSSSGSSSDGSSNSGPKCCNKPVPPNETTYFGGKGSITEGYAPISKPKTEGLIMDAVMDEMIDNIKDDRKRVVAKIKNIPSQKMVLKCICSYISLTLIHSCDEMTVYEYKKHAPVIKTYPYERPADKFFLGLLSLFGGAKDLNDFKKSCATRCSEHVKSLNNKS